MRTTAIFNHKGGVGKTITVIHMAEFLRRDHKARVLVIDCDAQANLTQFYGVKTDTGSTTTVLLDGSEYGALQSIQPTSTDGIDILPADDSLMELDLSQLHAGRVKPDIFRSLILELGRRGKYDFVLFDCPPAFNSACAAALMAADDVVVPIKLDAFSVTGMANVMRQVKSMQRINPHLRVAGILPTMWYRSDTIIEAEAILRRSRLHVYPHIRRSNRVDGVTFDREMTNAKCCHMQDYRRFTDAYKGGGLHG